MKIVKILLTMAGHEQFLEFCRSMKPPYQCPIAICARVYKTLAGIHTHMTTFDHTSLPATPAVSTTPGHTPGTGNVTFVAPIKML